MRPQRAHPWLCWLACLELGGCVGVVAQAPPTLCQVLDIALQHNPDLLQARLRVDSAHGERRIARALPNPTVAGIPGNPYQYSVGLPIDLTPERLYRTQAAKQGEDATEFGRQDVIRQVTFNVQQGFYDLLLADAQRQLAFEQRDILKQLLSADSVRLRAGDIPQRDLVKSELEVARAEARLARADAAVRAARLALQALMGIAHPDTGFRVSGGLDSAPVLTAPLDSLLPLALAIRPDLKGAQAQAAQSRALKALANAMLFPVPVVSVVYQDTPFKSGLRYAFGITMPVPLFDWGGGERERAAAGLEAAEVSVQRQRVQIETDVAAAVATFRSAQVLAERYRSGLLAKAAAALETARFAYQHGAASLLEVLDAVRAYGEIRSEYYAAVHDYWVAAYAVGRAVGADIVREEATHAPCALRGGLPIKGSSQSPEQNR